MSRCWSLLLILLLHIPLQAQVEYNVRLRNDGGDLQRLFETQDRVSLRRDAISPGLQARYAFLARTRLIKSLAKGQARQHPDIQGLYTLSLNGSDPQQALRLLEGSGAFEFVELNRTMRLDAHPQTLSVPTDDSIVAQWYHPFVRTFEAWETTRGSAQIKIGIIDTGLDYTHPEFEDQTAINMAEDANGNGRFEPWPSAEIRNGLSGDFDGIDNDNNGFADDVIGYDFTDQPRSAVGGDIVFPDPDPLDDNNHGTRVAGVIGAKPDNVVGGTGLAPGCKMVILRAFSAQGDGEDDDIARAIIYAADNGVQVLNLSFGDNVPSNTVHAAIQYAFSRGVVMVASAGNGTGDQLHYPSGYDEVISVSASAAEIETGREFLWPLSSFGVTVDLCAPGSGILSTVIQDTAADGTIKAYERTQGTSFSAPMVASAAGLLLSQRAYLSPPQIRGILTSSADDISSEGWDHLTGAGRLNMERALSTIGTSNVQLISPSNDGGSGGDSVWIIGTVLDPEFEQYHLEYQEGTEDFNPWQTILADQLYQRENDTLGLWLLKDLPEGAYTLRLRLDKTNGFTAEDRIRFVRDTTPPNTTVLLAQSAWDDDHRSMFVRFRCDDQAQHTLLFRREGSLNWQSLPYDRRTFNGEFLLEPSRLASGDYAYVIRSENLAGLTTETAEATFSFQSRYINRNTFVEKAHRAPVGQYLTRPFDFDADGLPEIVLSFYDAQYQPGPVQFWEFNGGFFVKMDSLDFKSVLLPKDVGDTDGDGLAELLVSVNDSLFVLEQPDAQSFPTEEMYKLEGQQRYAARFGDTDGDGRAELIAKDFEDYYVFKNNGGSFNESAQLEDRSPDYAGSNAPRAVVADFDQDGRPETGFLDFDGDFSLFEYQGGNYVNTFTDTTDIIREEAANLIAQGDFNGNGRPEFAIVLSTSDKRNLDFEKDPAYWWLRIFEATGDDTYAVVYEDYFYDVDTKNFNEISAANLDDDPAEELIFSTFPRNYVLDYQGGTYQMQWFLKGLLADRHLVGDFDGNGIPELALSRGDSSLFFERNLAYQGPQPVLDLTGTVRGDDVVQLNWSLIPTANEYELWRVRDPFNNDTAAVLSGLEANTFTDSNLEPGMLYLYLVRAVNPALNPTTSPFSNLIFLRPHPRPRLDSIAVLSPRQLEVWFSQPVEARPADAGYFTLSDEQQPLGIRATGDPGLSLHLNFGRPFTEGSYSLTVDTAFLDAEFAPIDPVFNSLNFAYTASESDALILTQWEREGDKTALLYFNYPLEEAPALDTNHYTLSPVGSIVGISWASEDMDVVRVEIKDARFGALGYPLSITVDSVCAITDQCIGTEGNTATFSEHRNDLTEVFAYPNPVRRHEQFEGMRFANLTRQATIEVFSLSGRFINRLEEVDGDGGLEWDMLDEGRKRIRTGLYIYRVSTRQEGVEDFVGKFSVVE